MSISIKLELKSECFPESDLDGIHCCTTWLTSLMVVRDILENVLLHNRVHSCAMWLIHLNISTEGFEKC